MRNSISQSITVLTSLVLPALSVYPVVFMIFDRTDRILAFLCSIAPALGIMAYSLFILNFTFNISINLSSCILVLLSMTAVSLSVYLTSKGKFTSITGRFELKNLKNSMITGIVALVALVVYVSIWHRLYCDTIATPVDCIPGMGVWGLKARAIFETGDIPWGMLMDKERPYLHGEYPLGYPIILAWTYMCLGGFDDQFIKMVPFCFAFVGLATTIGFLLKSKVSFPIAMLIGVLISSSATFREVSTSMYAETCLLTFVFPGLFMIYEFLGTRKKKYLFFGMALLAISVWIKNEGIVFFALTISFLLAKTVIYSSGQAQLRMISIYGLTASVMFILPWQMVSYIMGLSAYDFSIWNSSPRFANLILALQKFADTMIFKPFEYDALWIIILMTFPAMTILGKWNARTVFIVYSVCAPFVIFALSFVFSTREIEWHLNALPRILIIPGIVGITFSITNVFQARRDVSLLTNNG